jgi:uncharacterized membrane protein
MTDTRTEPTTQRIEAFSDGVFAIAITLLILEIRLPRMQDSGGRYGLGTALLGLWPSYCAYLFSFLVIGIYWANHHALFHLYKRTDHIFLLLNVLFLMCISFLPFPTAVLAQYMTDPAYRQASVEFYSLGLFLPAFGWLCMWVYGSRSYRLIDRNLTPSYISSTTRQFALSSVIYGVAIALSFINWLVPLVLAVGLALLYLLPPKRPDYKSD